MFRVVNNVKHYKITTPFLLAGFPTIHSNALVTVEEIAKYSSLYSISGSDASLTPYLLMAHLDVVPVTSEEWEEPPFAGNIKDNYIYGRGAVDMKQTLFVCDSETNH